MINRKSPTEIAPDPMKTMKTINARLLDRIDQLKTKNVDLKTVVQLNMICRIYYNSDIR